MLTALKGNIIEALSPDILGIHPSSYLVLEDGRVEGIYPTLPENMAETAVEDFGDAYTTPAQAQHLREQHHIFVHSYGGIEKVFAKEAPANQFVPEIAVGAELQHIPGERGTVGIPAIANQPPFSVPHFFDCITIYHIGIVGLGGPRHLFHHIGLQPVVRIYVQHIFAAGLPQSAQTGLGETGVGLLDDFHRTIRVLGQDFGQNLHRPVLGPVIDKDEFDVLPGLFQQGTGTAGDIGFYAVKRYDDGDFHR